MVMLLLSIMTMMVKTSSAVTDDDDVDINDTKEMRLTGRLLDCYKAVIYSSVVVEGNEVNRRRRLRRYDLVITG